MLSFLTQPLRYGFTARTGTILHNCREINLGVVLRVTDHRNSYLLRITISIPVSVYQLHQQPPMRMKGLDSCFGITRLGATYSLKIMERKATDVVGVVERGKSTT